MTKYISRGAAICIADYAVDEHPFDKNPEKPETFSDYNQGWNDACDFIRDRLENAEKADVAEVRHARWIRVDSTKCKCSECDAVAFIAQYPPSADKNYCPNCGARMDGGADDEE